MPGKLLNAVGEGWEDEHKVMEDSWGQEWTHTQRRILEFTCNSAYFLAIVQVTLMLKFTLVNFLPAGPVGGRDHQQDQSSFHLPAGYDQLGAQLWPRL